MSLENPKDSLAAARPRLSTVPGKPLWWLGLAMEEGARKYGRHNYRAAPVRASIYYDAMLRHMMAWWEGEDRDPDSGLPHAAKAMACLAILLDAEEHGMLIDDRPPATTSMLVEIRAECERLVRATPCPMPPVTACQRTQDGEKPDDA